MDRREFLGAVAAPLLLGSLPDALSRPRGGTPLALVTADLEASVVAVDLSSGRVVRRVRTPADPRSIESVGGTAALVAHLGPGRLTLVGNDLRVRGIRGLLDEPRYAAVTPEGRWAYVTDSGRGELAVVDVRARRIVRRLKLGGAPRHLTIHPAKPRRLWIVLGNAAPEIAIVDATRPERPTVVDRVRPPFPAHDVGYAPRGAHVWVTSGDRRRLAIFDDHGTRLVRELRGDAPPQHVTFIDDRAYVTSGDDGLLRVHRLDGRLLRTIRIPGGSYNVQQGWGVVLTPSLSQGTLCVLSARGATRLRRDVARSSHDACFVMAP